MEITDSYRNIIIITVRTDNQIVSCHSYGINSDYDEISTKIPSLRDCNDEMIFRKLMYQSCFNILKLTYSQINAHFVSTILSAIWILWFCSVGATAL